PLRTLAGLEGNFQRNRNLWTAATRSTSPETGNFLSLSCGLFVGCYRRAGCRGPPNRLRKRMFPSGRRKLLEVKEVRGWCGRREALPLHLPCGISHQNHVLAKALGHVGCHADETFRAEGDAVLDRAAAADIGALADAHLAGDDHARANDGEILNRSEEHTSELQSR